VLNVHMHHIAHNLQGYRSMLHPGVKMMVMVKAFSYGSGTAEIANMLAFNRVDYLAVAYADEGVELRRNGVHLPIMVMNPEPDTFAQLLEYHLEPEMYNFRILQLFTQFLQNEKYAGAAIPVHIKLDTGMHRLGFMSEEIDALANAVLQNPLLHIKSIFTHLAAADESEHDTFSQQQIAQFKIASDTLIKKLGYTPLLHILNSPGISKFPDAQMDMVRLGIGLYGDDPAKHVSDKLLYTSTLETTVTQIKQIAAGESVGYGRSFIAGENMCIATLNIGYADGFKRSLGNGVAKVWINGNLCPVVGRVCMDMIMVDITGAENIIEGDIAEIFGAHISLHQFAQWMQTIPYEVLTGISQRVKRVYVQEG
ncbi:MAG: alanine racemase, partial [Chitinophagales bacterium]